MLSEVSGPVPRSAVFLPADPPREGRVAFWEPTGPGGPEAVRAGSGELRVVTPGLRLATVPALLLPVGAALPLLTRARTAAAAPAPGSSATGPSDAWPSDAGASDAGSSDAGPSATAFWGAAALLALRLVARGLLLPGLSPEGHDAWRIGPLDAEALDEIRELAAAMPPAAHCVPVGPDDTTAPPRLPSPEPLLRAFLDAVADTLPRSPAASVVAGGPAYAAAGPAAAAPPPGTGLRAWADEVAAGHDRGIRISLRVELRGAGRAEEGEEGEEGAETPAPSFRAVLQLHGLADASLVADARDVWAAAGPTGAAFPPRARLDALRALRRAVKLWPPLTPMLGAAVPDSVDLADEEVAELLGETAGVLAADGVQVHWPRGLARTLTSRAVATLPVTSTRPGRATAPGSVPPALLGAGSLLSFDWRHSLGDGADDLTPAELDRLAEDKRPLVRLRDQWVLVDPAAVRRARARRDGPVPVAAADALAAVLTGSAEVEGARVDVTASGALAALRERLTGEPAPVVAPVGLRATLRDYQLRGLAWLDLMTSLGLGG
ncbi:SNF2 helicase-associated domain-containing protein, partial [Streptomyces lavendulae]